MIKVKYITNFKNYIIWSDGRIYSINVGRFLKPKFNGKYYFYTLCKNGARISFYIHILVLKHFGPQKPSPEHEVNHKDGVKKHNWIDNLEWVTKSDNLKHAHKLGLKSAKGEKNSQAKLNELDVIKIRKLYNTGEYTQKRLMDIYRLSSGHISSIISGRKWRHI